MSGLIRVSLYIVIAIVALFVAAIILKIVVAGAFLAAVAMLALFIYNFGRSLFRRVTATQRPPLMLR